MGVGARREATLLVVDNFVWEVPRDVLRDVVPVLAVAVEGAKDDRHRAVVGRVHPQAERVLVGLRAVGVDPRLAVSAVFLDLPRGSQGGREGQQTDRSECMPSLMHAFPGRRRSPRPARAHAQQAPLATLVRAWRCIGGIGTRRVF